MSCEFRDHGLHPDSACEKMPKATPQQVSTAWPYGVRQDRVDGSRYRIGPYISHMEQCIVSACLTMSFLTWHLLR